jgi:hypothetical protein
VSVIPHPPLYPVGEQTTAELARYRAALESALRTAVEGSADAVVIQARLTGVTEEQANREVTTGIPASWADAR